MNVPDSNRLHAARCHQSRLALKLQKSYELAVNQNFVFLAGCRMVKGDFPGSQAHGKEFISVANSTRLALVEVDARHSVIPLSI
jgi:hypothetical protein